MTSQPAYERPAEITDPADPRVADFTDLTDVALRSAREPAEGLFIAEGERTIRRAVEAGYALRSVLTSARWLPGLQAALERSAGTGDRPDVFVATEDVLRATTGYRVHRGALASFARRPLPAVGDVLAAARRVVVIEDLVDHTNVGLVFRSAAALGIDAVLLSAGCADPLYRRAIRTSMGAVLSLPYARLSGGAAGLGELRTHGHRLLALTPDDDATSLPVAIAAAGEQVALLVGTEGDGLSRRWLATADERVRIPMPHRSTLVDSLNAAAAVAIACYVLTADPPH